MYKRQVLPLHKTRTPCSRISCISEKSVIAKVAQRRALDCWTASANAPRRGWPEIGIYPFEVACQQLSSFISRTFFEFLSPFRMKILALQLSYTYSENACILRCWKPIEQIPACKTNHFQTEIVFCEAFGYPYKFVRFIARFIFNLILNYCFRLFQEVRPFSRANAKRMYAFSSFWKKLFKQEHQKYMFTPN